MWWGEKIGRVLSFFPPLWERGPGQCWLAGLTACQEEQLGAPAVGKPQAQELVEPFELGDQTAGLGRISRKAVNGLGKDAFENLSSWVFLCRLMLFLCCCDRLKFTFILYLLKWQVGPVSFGLGALEKIKFLIQWELATLSVCLLSVTFKPSILNPGLKYYRFHRDLVSWWSIWLWKILIFVFTCKICCQACWVDLHLTLGLGLQV